MCVSVTERENVKIGIDGNETKQSKREMSKRERDEKEDEGGVEKRMKMGCVSEAQEILEISKEVKEKLKKMKAFLKSEYEKNCRYGDRGETYLHYAAYLGHVEATKLLLENGVEVNAVNEIKYTALHYAAEEGHVDVAKVLIQNGC